MLKKTRMYGEQLPEKMDANSSSGMTWLKMHKRIVFTQTIQKAKSTIMTGKEFVIRGKDFEHAF